MLWLELTKRSTISRIYHPNLAPSNLYAQAAVTRLSGNRRDFEGMAIITQPAGNGGREDMDTGTDNADAQQIVNVIVPTVIKSDEGILTPHCVQLIVDLAAWVQCIYGTSWSAYTGPRRRKSSCAMRRLYRISSKRRTPFSNAAIIWIASHWMPTLPGSAIKISVPSS